MLEAGDPFSGWWAKEWGPFQRPDTFGGDDENDLLGLLFDPPHHQLWYTVQTSCDSTGVARWAPLAQILRVDVLAGGLGGLAAGWLALTLALSSCGLLLFSGYCTVIRASALCDWLAPLLKANKWPRVGPLLCPGVLAS